MLEREKQGKFSFKHVKFDVDVNKSMGLNSV